MGKGGAEDIPLIREVCFAATILVTILIRLEAILIIVHILILAVLIIFAVMVISVVSVHLADVLQGVPAGEVALADNNHVGRRAAAAAAGGLHPGCSHGLVHRRLRALQRRLRRPGASITLDFLQLPNFIGTLQPDRLQLGVLHRVSDLDLMGLLWRAAAGLQHRQRNPRAKP